MGQTVGQKVSPGTGEGASTLNRTSLYLGVGSGGKWSGGFFDNEGKRRHQYRVEIDKRSVGKKREEAGRNIGHHLETMYTGNNCWFGRHPTNPGEGIKFNRVEKVLGSHLGGCS